MLLHILDEGRCASRSRLPDGSREFDFKHCIFFFTSNYILSGDNQDTPKNPIGFSISNDVEDISLDDGAVKKDVWSLKTSAYDTGSLSFFNGEIEATKKDVKDGNTIKGELINRTNKRIEEAKITFKVYNQDGALIDALSDSIKAWDSGEKWIYNTTIEDNNSLKYEFAELSIIY